MTFEKLCSSKFSIFLSFLLIDLSSSMKNISMIESYAKVSVNRPQLSIHTDRNESYRPSVSQARSFSDYTINRSPIYVPSSKKLRNGEAVDHPTANRIKSLDSPVQAQDRFHPPAIFEHSVAHSNAVTQKIEPVRTSGSDKLKFPVPSYATLPKEVYSTNYDYQTDSKPSSNDSPPSDAMEYPPNSEDTFSKVNQFKNYRSHINVEFNWDQSFMGFVVDS